jgi:hypothetical protein
MDSDSSKDNMDSDSAKDNMDSDSAKDNLYLDNREKVQNLPLFVNFGNQAGRKLSGKIQNIDSDEREAKLALKRASRRVRDKKNRDKKRAEKARIAAFNANASSSSQIMKNRIYIVLTIAIDNPFPEREESVSDVF